MVKPLTVYKASAGSGKTFTLATEYIKLLGHQSHQLSQHPGRHLHQQGYGGDEDAHPQSAVWHLEHLPDSQSYLEKIKKETGLPDDVIAKRAGEALHLLLHNYNYFRVETIDTFFQSVLRNLARELDLTANLRIGLNDTQVEEQAVDQLIDSLTHTDVMLQWLLKYIMETISDDRSWNIIGQVKQFGKTIFRDYYKERSTELNRLISKEGFLEAYMKQMRQIRADAGQRMKEIAQEFFDTLENEGT